jgi:hypothetical protein
VSTPTPLEELLTAASAEVNMAGRSGQVSVRVFERYVSELVRLLQQERELARLRAQDHDDQVARLNNRLRARRTRATAQLARRGLPPTTFPMLVCGAELMASAVIYGLVDPREPARVRYVGQAVNAEARMAGHLNGRSRPPRPMEAWLTALRTEGVTPDMVDRISQLLGHASLSQTMIYVNFQPDTTEEADIARGSLRELAGPSGVTSIAERRREA